MGSVPDVRTSFQKCEKSFLRRIPTDDRPRGKSATGHTVIDRVTQVKATSR